MPPPAGEMLSIHSSFSTNIQTHRNPPRDQIGLPISTSLRKFWLAALSWASRHFQHYSDTSISPTIKRQVVTERKKTDETCLIKSINVTQCNGRENLKMIIMRGIPQKKTKSRNYLMPRKEMRKQRTEEASCSRNLGDP
jgi:hypothetical protein